ncbi:MAG: VWA domain-containing protein [Thermoanaerobaculia bacterium]|nr:VWA domain-containing protein [Thermoanaerobaculia bacterium]
MHSPQDRVLRHATLLLFVLAGGSNGASALAQESPPATAAAEDFAERVDVEVVNVDVVVTDKAKQRILDLGRDDFELLVDGRPVAIEYFAGPRLAGATAAAAPALPPTGGIATVPGTPVQGVAPTNLILYIDQTALESQDRKTAIQELREYLRARPAGADRVTVAAFDQRLQIVAPATTDPAAIAAAFDQIERRPSFAALGLGEERQLQREIRDLGTYGGDARTIEQAIVSWGEQQIDRERRSIAALGQLVDSLAALEGRKVVVLATAGIEANPAQFLLDALDQKRGALVSSDTNRGPALELAGQTLLMEFEEMIQGAQNARVTVYSLSPVVRPPAEGGADVWGAGSSSARPLPHDFGAAEAAASIARLTGATGGASYTIWGDLDRRLEGVTADIDAAYSLGFSTGLEAGENDHRIEVRTRRADLTVRHRESFRRRGASDRVTTALTAAATLGQTENPLEISLSLGAGRPDDQKKSGEIVPIAVGIPLRLIALVPQGSERRGSVEVRVSIEDARGRLQESGVTIVPIVIPEGDLEQALAATWYHRAEVRLSPGRQRVAVAVVDQVSGLQSTVFEETEIPEKK